MRAVVVLSLLAIVLLEVSARNWHSDFQSYIKTYQKTYASVDEYRIRLANYKVNFFYDSFILTIITRVNILFILTRYIILLYLFLT